MKWIKIRKKLMNKLIINNKKRKRQMEKQFKKRNGISTMRHGKGKKKGKLKKISQIKKMTKRKKNKKLLKVRKK